MSCSLIKGCISMNTFLIASDMLNHVLEAVIFVSGKNKVLSKNLNFCQQTGTLDRLFLKNSYNRIFCTISNLILHSTLSNDT